MSSLRSYIRILEIYDCPKHWNVYSVLIFEIAEKLRQQIGAFRLSRYFIYLFVSKTKHLQSQVEDGEVHSPIRL